MTLQIQMIGTGSAFAKSYFNNNALLRTGDFTLLLDCGITAPLALHALSVGLDTLDGILVSHMHADHIGGIEEIAFQLLYVYNRRRIKLYVPAAIEEMLWERSLRGGLENASEGLLSLQDFFDVVPLREEELHELHAGLSVRLLPCVHVPDKPSCSILLNERIFYSADTTFMPERLLSLHEQGIEQILHDCQLAGPGVVHATLDELLTLPLPVQEKVLLMHYGDSMPSFAGRSGAMRFMEQGKIYTF